MIQQIKIIGAIDDFANGQISKDVVTEVIAKNKEINFDWTVVSHLKNNLGLGKYALFMSEDVVKNSKSFMWFMGQESTPDGISSLVKEYQPDGLYISEASFYGQDLIPPVEAFKNAIINNLKFIATGKYFSKDDFSLNVFIPVGYMEAPPAANNHIMLSPKIHDSGFKSTNVLGIENPLDIKGIEYKELIPGNKTKAFYVPLEVKIK